MRPHQEVSRAAYMTALEQRITDLGYEFVDFAVSVAAPHTLAIRAHALWLHLCDVIPLARLTSSRFMLNDSSEWARGKSVDVDFVPVKEALKYSIGSYLIDKWKVCWSRHDSNSLS